MVQEHTRQKVLPWEQVVLLRQAHEPPPLRHPLLLPACRGAVCQSPDVLAAEAPAQIAAPAEQFVVLATELVEAGPLSLLDCDRS